MHRHLTFIKVNMEKYGMTRGHAALVFKRPNNDMGEIYLSVSRSHERVAELLDLDTSTEIGLLTYDTRLDDIRGTLRELEIPAYAFWWRHTLIGLFIVIGFWTSLVVGCLLLAILDAA